MVCVLGQDFFKKVYFMPDVSGDLGCMLFENFDFEGGFGYVRSSKTRKKIKSRQEQAYVFWSGSMDPSGECS